MVRINRGGSKKLKTQDCLTCPARRQAEWAVASDAEMRQVRDAKTSLSLQRGQFLFIQGQYSPWLFCIGKGTLAVARSEEGAGTIFLRLVHAGSTIGYRNHLNDTIPTTSAKAVKACQVCKIDPDVFAALLKNNQALGKIFLLSLARELEATETAMVELAALPVRSRLARLLLSLVETEPARVSGSGVEIETPMTWRDMSELINTRPETLARAIKALESEGVIFHSGHSIHIPRLESLRKEGEAR